MKFKNIKEFISYFTTPFVRPKLRFYIGRIAVGTPYFFPRKTIEDPDKPGYLKFIDKKIGFDIVRLGWKTKWSQFRFEWNPVISFVFFKWQIAITIVAPEKDHYWESWLYYQYETDKTKSKLERAIQCQKKYPQIWETSKDGVRTRVDYYDIILKKKYRVKNIDEIREDKLNSLLKQHGIDFVLEIKNKSYGSKIKTQFRTTQIIKFFYRILYNVWCDISRILLWEV